MAEPVMPQGVEHYATQQDLIDSFGWEEVQQLSNLDDSAAREINGDRISQVIGEASAEIDGYLASRYSLPLPTVPKILELCCLDIVRYRLDKNQQREDVRQRYEDRLRFLELLAKGQMSLGLPRSDEQTLVTGGSPQFTTPDPVFSNAILEGF